MHATADSVKAFVIGTISELTRCAPQAVTSGALLADLGVDSLSITTLAAFIEGEYGCTLAPAQLRSLYLAVDLEDVLRAVGAVVSGAESPVMLPAPREQSGR